MSDLLSIEALRLSMNIAATQQRLALENIASHSISNAGSQRADFSTLLAEVNALPAEQRAQVISNLSSQWQEVESSYIQQSHKKATLDEEVALSMKASGSYRKLAEVLNRKLGLMNLAISGGKR
ncbi:hypothetical protein PSECIP111951_00313 [Pseudoalteromonas holothuriae]|uniref:Flagellar basal body rod protein FlgB n=1 Tax=Pseudoalteromonas holothuriae TaxID=2963714 RepID=A0A9W4QZW5_9GAMM|nr:MULTISPECIES: hypothetical protein [unclassified Pseudoalteromonas]CAH9051025.1 hypothetical protein PSECIP111951_00313 [Pseudoalteromonas sp. CIP111951]CAH9061684.1 hypothetical protein PSECIP111854_02861 [Pseudoalteromonas sp. CIP111854]